MCSVVLCYVVCCICVVWCGVVCCDFYFCESLFSRGHFLMFHFLIFFLLLSFSRFLFPFILRYSALPVLFPRHTLPCYPTGGENVSRSAVLGFLLGLAHGEAAWPKHLKEGLGESAAYQKEIAEFAEKFAPQGDL
jgi:hypothetical protein